MKLSLLVLLPAAAFAQTPPGWTPELAMQVKSIGEVVPAPDGARVAWTESHAVMEPERSEMATQIFLANADGSHRRQLTRDEKSASSPSFGRAATKPRRNPGLEGDVLLAALKRRTG